jgi:uncharacterized protein (TIGR02466 family)
MPIQNWFPTPIYVEPILNGRSASRFNRELLEQCYLVRKTDGDGRDWSKENYLAGYSSYGSITDLHRRYPHFSELQSKIDRHMKRMTKHLQMDLQDGRLEMVTMWINIMPKGCAHSLHLHPLSILSGTYYVSIPNGASAIKFEDPRLASFMASPAKLENAKPHNKTFVTLQPKAGQVALWESWLRHEVPRNQSSADRVSISFNYDWLQ